MGNPTQLGDTLVIMHKYLVWPLAGMLAMALLMPQLVAAQQSQTSSDAPPKLEKLEEGEPPNIKIGKPEDRRKITETRDDGHVKEIKVENGKSTYYIKPNEPVGNSLPGDTQSTTNRGVQWKVKEFDLGSKPPKNEGSDDAASAGGTSVVAPPQK